MSTATETLPAPKPGDAFEFAGVKFKLTKNGAIRRPSLLKILRSGKIKIRCTGNYSDDYAFDAANNFGRDAEVDAAALADRIEWSPSGWWFYFSTGRRLRVSCHHFLSYEVEEVA